MEDDWEIIKGGKSAILENMKEKDKPMIKINIIETYDEVNNDIDTKFEVKIIEKGGKEKLIEEFDDVEEAFKKVEELKKVL
jgi:hypothetical protein